jgi:hypothetical protein
MHSYRIAKLALFLVVAGARPGESLQLRIEAPPEFAAIRRRLESMDSQRFADIAPLVGATEGGRIIQVELVPESSDLARNTSQWIAGFTVHDVVVILPARSPGYPNHTLEDVLRHELAHALIWRASGGRSIPRWFNEGLAMAAERERKFEDQTELLYQLVSGSKTSLAELAHLFDGGPNDQTRAYALAGAIIHDVLQQHGSAAGSEIIQQVGRGTPFDVAFSTVVGVTPSVAESEFWRRQRIWTNWVPIITSTTTLWLVVTLLALIAIYRRWRKNLEMERQWEKEENDDDSELRAQ